MDTDNEITVVASAISPIAVYKAEAPAYDFGKKRLVRNVAFSSAVGIRVTTIFHVNSADKEAGRTKRMRETKVLSGLFTIAVETSQGLIEGLATVEIGRKNSTFGFKDNPALLSL